MSRLSVFLWFGIGFGIPLLLLSLIPGVLQRKSTRWLAQHSRLINTISGLLLVGIGVYDFIVNWELIRLVLGF